MGRNPKPIPRADLDAAQAAIDAGSSLRAQAMALSIKNGAFKRNGKARRDAMVSHEHLRKALKAVKESDCQRKDSGPETDPRQKTGVEVVGRDTIPQPTTKGEDLVSRKANCTNNDSSTPTGKCTGDGSDSDTEGGRD